MQSLINSLTQQQLNVVISMVDLIDAINSTNQFVFEDDDFECNCNQYEIDMFFESVSTEEFWREIFIVQNKCAEIQLHNDLWVHSVDTRVGF